MTAVCEWCGNPATDTQALIWDSGQLTHEPIPGGGLGGGLSDVEYDDRHVGCPDLAPGYAECARCDAAFPIREMREAELHLRILDDGEIEPRSRGRWRPRSGDRVPYWDRIDSAWEDGIPTHRGAKGVILEVSPTGRPQSVCARCAADWPPPERRARRSEATPAAGGPKRDLKAERADAVPALGPGLTWPELSGLWDLKERQTKSLIKELLTEGLLVVTEVPSARGGSALKRYRRAGE